MAFIRKNAKWYVAEIVEEIRAQGSRRNVVHTNQTLVRADSPNEAFEKATALGRQGNATYKNPGGKAITIRFRGLKDLNVVHEKLGHGAEIGFRRAVGVSEGKIKSWIVSKNKLGAFAPLKPQPEPDYASAEVLEKVYKLWPYLHDPQDNSIPKHAKRNHSGRHPPPSSPDMHHCS